MYRARARERERERERARERELRVLLHKHLYCLVLSLSRALSLSVIDHRCVLLQTAWGVRPSCRAAHHARVRLPRRRGFPAARVRVHCRSLHQGAAPRSDFTASCARSHARTLALSCMHTCMHERTHAHDPRTLPTMMMIVYWYLFSNHYTRECIHTCEKRKECGSPQSSPGFI